MYSETFSRQVSHLERGNSHLGSDGSSSSETLGSMGPSLDDRRAILTSGVFEFMEELESKDTCLSEETEQYVIVSVRVRDKRRVPKKKKNIRREHVEIRCGYKKQGCDEDGLCSLWCVRTRTGLVSLGAARDRNIVTFRALQPMLHREKERPQLPAKP